MAKIVFAAAVALCALLGVAQCSPASLTPAVIGKSSVAGVNGVVDDFYKCGGLGTFVQLRISDCIGRCSFYPTHLYIVEGDYFPSGAISSLSLGVDFVFMGQPTRIMEFALENSSVQPGFLYTVRFNVVPNDILSGQVAKFRAILFRTADRLIETCVETEVDILPFP